MENQEHAHGWAGAPITLIEYGDYECEKAVRAQNVVEQLEDAFLGQLYFIFRHFPVRQLHPHAEKAAQAAEAAGAQNMFWEMHGRLLKNQDALDEASLLEYAQELDLDMVTFERDLEENRFSDKITQDF